MDIVGATITDVNVDLHGDEGFTDKLDLHLDNERVVQIRGGSEEGLFHVIVETSDHRVECEHLSIKEIDISTPAALDGHRRTALSIPATIEVCTACTAHRAVIGPIGEKTYSGEWTA